ncbi:MAG: hypothetical protein A2516_02555 [Alphaproteobacteria bacterium RIFOXYD12_FULL_60_8]|nr:MAG: hypothetical protein A2516_02555 [Alphaproteobacteria bacterium RIFOXYD12_FULL_60_8]
MSTNSWRAAIVDAKPIKVGLVQINNSFSGQHYFPYSAGLLQIYAERHLPEPGKYRFLLPVYARIPVQEAVASLLDADIVGFSCYVWNAQTSLRIARELKRKKPQVLIVFGGPHVPDQSESFLRGNPFIDVACHGEGEAVFTSLLSHAPQGDLEAVPSISYLDSNGVLRQTQKGERLRDLAQVPSPYLEGTFEPLMRAHPDEHWIALWETNRGCPFSCTFCDWGSAVAGKVNTWALERLYEEYDWFGRHKVEFIFCADANFGMLERDLDIARYCAQTKAKHGYPQAMSIQNTKNATERSYQVQKILSDAGLNKGVVISLQSVDKDTLRAIKRDNISLDSYFTIQQRFADQGIETMTDIILGLPAETYDTFADGVSSVIERGQHNRIQFNNLCLLPNAEMGAPEYQERFGMESVETKVVNIHGEFAEPLDGIYETQQLVVGTNSMPKADWARTRAFCWMAGLLYFDKLLQIPIAVTKQLSGLSYRDIIEFFSEGRFEKGGHFPVLSEIRTLFLDKARDIQAGGMEYCHSREWLNIWWPADEYVFIKLCVEGKLASFCQEAETALQMLCAQAGAAQPSAEIIHEAVLLNRNLLKVPFQKEDLELDLSCNMGEFYRSLIVGRPIALERRHCRYRIDRTRERWDSWEEWFRKVVWYGNKKGAYLYGNTPVDPKAELAGHF